MVLMDVKRLKVMYYIQLYQRRIARAYSKRIKPGKIKECDLVLKHMKPLLTDPRRKFKPNWKGLYLLKNIFLKGVAILFDLKGNKFRNFINLDKLKKYFL